MAELTTPGDIETLDLGRLSGVLPTPKRFVIPGWAPAGEMTLFSGPGSAGKSLLGQQWATAFAAGVPTLGIDMRQGAAIYISCEDDAEQLHFRQHHLCKALGVNMSDLAGELYLASLRGHLDNIIGIVTDDKGRKALSPAYDRLAKLIRQTKSQLVFVDNLAHVFDGNENDRGDVTQFTTILNRLAGETGASIILLSHTNKAFNQGNRQGNSFSGSTAWVNAVRSQFVIEHDVDTDRRTLSLEKANYTRKGEKLTFVWDDWAFVRESDLSAGRRAELTEIVQAANDNKLFLTCLAERNRQRRQVTEKPTSRIYAPKEFAGMSESEGIGKARLQAAMDRLFRIDAIAHVKLWTADDRHPVFGLREILDMGAGDFAHEYSEHG